MRSNHATRNTANNHLNALYGNPYDYPPDSLRRNFL